MISSGLFQNTVGFHATHPFIHQHYYWNTYRKFYFYIQLLSGCQSHWITQSFTLFKRTHPCSPPLSSWDHCWYFTLHSPIHSSQYSVAYMTMILTYLFLLHVFLISNLYLPTDQRIILLCDLQSIFHYLTHCFLILGVNVTVNEIPRYRDITNLQKPHIISLLLLTTLLKQLWINVSSSCVHISAKIWKYQRKRKLISQKCYHNKKY